MNLPKILTSVGLACDAIGGMLLAVEAIRLENLLVLRDRVLPAIRLSFESPRIFYGATSQKDLDLNRKRGFGGHESLRDVPRHRRARSRIRGGRV